jgi:hypothetical protein
VKSREDQTPEEATALLKRIKQQAYDQKSQHPTETHGQRLERLARENGYSTLAALQARSKQHGSL